MVCGSLQKLKAVSYSYQATLDHPIQYLASTLTNQKKTLGVRDCPAGGNKSHLKHIKDKVNAWIDKMKNGHLPSSMGWVACRFQLWPGVRYGIGTTTNALEKADEALDKSDYRMLNVLTQTRKDGDAFILLLVDLDSSVLPPSN